MPMLKVSPSIARIPPYIPGKSARSLEAESGIRRATQLASNQNSLGASPMALAAVRRELTYLWQYPDSQSVALREALAIRWKVSPSQIITGNGSDEVIELVIRTYLMPGDNAIMASPTFPVYRSAVMASHGTPVEIPLLDGRHHLSQMASAVDKKTKLVFICNPNNPTGTIVSHEALVRFLSCLPSRVLVVLDEAYADYVDDPAFPRSVELVSKRVPIIFLRTFSKLYGLAGLRIGYGVSRLPVIRDMHRIRQPFNTNRLAQMAAVSALSDDAHVARSLRVNRIGKNYLCRSFEKMGIPYLLSEANFVYFDTKRGKHLDPNVYSNAPAGQKVYDALLRRGVIIRPMGGTHFRVTVGTPSQNRKFVKALEEVL